MQHDLTGDISVPENSQSRELDERLRLMLEIGDPDILVDLRINNGFKGTKFNIFWNELKLYFEEVIFKKLLLITRNFLKLI